MATIAIEEEAVAIEIAIESVIGIAIENDIEFVNETEESRRERERGKKDNTENDAQPRPTGPPPLLLKRLVALCFIYLYITMSKQKREKC